MGWQAAAQEGRPGHCHKHNPPPSPLHFVLSSSLLRFSDACSAAHKYHHRLLLGCRRISSFSPNLPAPVLQQRSLDMDAPAPGYGLGLGVGGSKQGADEEDAAAEERFDPANFLVDYEEDEILGDPNEEQPMFVDGVYDVAQVNNFIETNEWNLLEEHLVSAMPRSQRNAHPSLVHPTPFITIWRRRVMDLIGGGRYDEAAQIFVDKVVPLKTVVTAYADADKLSEEIAQIERSVGSRTSFAHAHCGTELMMKLINDYMRLYLPDVIGHRCPKGKQSALWEFALSLSVPVRGLKKHPHVRCLVCSVTDFKGCKIGVDMTEHLQVCPGMTPEAERRYRDALRKGGSKKKRYLANVVDVSVSKAPKLTANLPSHTLHIIHQKVQDGRQVLDTMRSNQQADVNLGINSLDGILESIGGLVALAMQGQAAAPPPQAQQPIPAQAVIAVAVPVPLQAPAPAAANPPAPAPAPPAHQDVPAPPPALQGAPQDAPAPPPALQGAPQDAPAPPPALQGAPQDAPALPPAIQLQGLPQDAPVPPAALQGAVVPPPPPAPAPEDGVPDYYSAFDYSEFLPELPEL
ncbi:uncharacterized protein LOC123449839 [Hordeum vulgare subsp. vulgare]|uniref:uncharacterized protein LOC123449839 n=1 Tax=Hordeum vulgare subsp. vulgare TaxID=112509 RepID=UPI001D1A3F82|nr:uncharacterized protein LOC123449839 [Hordeum vulgare subsp. vulgare]